MNKKMRLLPLVGATYFMVAGGPYGLEDIIGKAGYGRALLLLLLIPIVWSLPTSLMVGELASAIPKEGGFYEWVRKALGGFWGFQEAWLSLSASIFDMALYPATFVLYLNRIAPDWTAGNRGLMWSLAVVAGCIAWNLSGAKAVGGGSVWLFTGMLAPFAALVAFGFWRGFALHGAAGGWHAIAASTATPDMAGAVSFCLWNYMGWDNASTIAQEVENPQRTYPRAMLLSAALVAATYVLPLAAVAFAGVPADKFTVGAWADAAKANGGTGFWGVALGLAVVIGGTISGVGMFNALMLSYTRLPYALAKERLLPRAFTRVNKDGAPWLSVLLCGVAWGLALKLPFAKLISLDLVLYGASLVLEFIALVVLRVREPALIRPFRVPGNLFGAVLVGVGPTLLIAYAMWAARSEQVLGMSALGFAAIVAACGPVIYLVAKSLQRPQTG